MLGGVAFVARRPAVWRWAIVPALLATVLFAGLGYGAITAAFGLAEHTLSGGVAGSWSEVWTWVLGVLLSAIGLLVAMLLALTLAQPLSGFALEEIARRQESELGGTPWPAIPPLRAFVRGLSVALTALGLSLPIVTALTIVTVLLPPASCVTVPLKVLVTSLALAYDLLDYPLSLRGTSVSDRLRFFRANFPAVLGFGLAAAGLLFVPGLSLLLLPFAVAGATRLVVEASR